jgi:hypothetical protein
LHLRPARQHFPRWPIAPSQKVRQYPSKMDQSTSKVISCHQFLCSANSIRGCYLQM